MNNNNIIIGATYWSNDMRRVRVISEGEGFDGWFRCEEVVSGDSKHFNAERLCVRHPFTGEVA